MEWYTVARLSDHMETTPEGFLLVRDVPVARCGVQLYRQGEIPGIDANDDGWIEVDREPSEVFRPASIASFSGKPIVEDHPYQLVNPSNYADLALGHIGNPRRGENTDHDLLLADLLFTTDKGIALVRGGGKRALSVGYNAYYERAGKGLGRQKDIICNHIAVVDEGRCGERCTILDGRAVYNDAVAEDRPDEDADIDYACDADIDFRDDFVESQHPRGASGTSKGGQFVSQGGGGAGTASHAASVPGPSAKVVQTHGPSKQLGAKVKQALTTGHGLEALKQEIQQYGAKYQNAGYKSYAKALLAHIAKAEASGGGTAAPAASGAPLAPQPPEAPAAPTAPPAAPTAPPAAPAGPVPYPGSPGQQKIYEIATGSGSAWGKLKAIAEVQASPSSGPNTKAFGQEWITALGGASTPAVAAPTAPSAPAKSKGQYGGVLSTAPAHTARYKRAVDMMEAAKKPEGTGKSTGDKAAARKICPTLAPAHWNKAPEAAKAAIGKYWDGYYDNINGALRDPKKEKGDALIQEAISEIDEQFFAEGAELTADVRLTRGEDVPPEQIDEWIKGLEAGLPVSYHKEGFISTSMHSRPAFSQKNTWYIIAAKKGTPALGIDTISTHHENEVLLRHGQTFEIYQIEKGSGKTYVYMVTK
jgi:hypothetical protein